MITVTLRRAALIGAEAGTRLADAIFANSAARRPLGR